MSPGIWESFGALGHCPAGTLYSRKKSSEGSQSGNGQCLPFKSKFLTATHLWCLRPCKEAQSWSPQVSGAKEYMATVLLSPYPFRTWWVASHSLALYHFLQISPPTPHNYKHQSNAKTRKLSMPCKDDDLASVGLSSWQRPWGTYLQTLLSTPLQPLFS